MRSLLKKLYGATAMKRNSKTVQRLNAYANKRIDLPCDVFEATRQHEGALVHGYWLRVYNTDKTQWLRLEFIGTTYVGALWRIARIARELSTTVIVRGDSDAQPR